MVVSTTSQNGPFSASRNGSASDAASYVIPGFDMGRLDGGYYGLGRSELVEATIMAAASYGEFGGLVDNYPTLSALTANDIGFSSKNTNKFDMDSDGTFHGTPSGPINKILAFFMGTSVKKAAQAKAFVTEDGKMYVSFRGTDFEPDKQKADVATFPAILHWAENYLDSYEPFLESLAEYAEVNGITDITFTGISLGGAAVNSLAHFKDKKFGGAFSDAEFVAFASPTTISGATNIGWQNDWVFNNVFGKEHYDARTNGIIFYDEEYAEDKKNGGWSSHTFTDDTFVPAIPAGLVKIAESRFFDMVDQNSKVVIDSFGQVVEASDVDFGSRATGQETYVMGEDRDDALLGTAGTDMIEARYGNDYVDSRGGDDVVYTGAGSDVVFAGAGDDFVFIEDDNNFVNAGSGDDIIVVGAKSSGDEFDASVRDLPDLSGLPGPRYESDDYDFSFSPLSVVETRNDRGMKITYSVTNNGHVDTTNDGVMKFYAVNNETGRKVYLSSERIKKSSLQEGETDKETHRITLEKSFGREVKYGDWSLEATMTGFAEGAFDTVTRSVSLSDVFKFGKVDGYETDAQDTQNGSFVDGIGFTDVVSMQETTKYVKFFTALSNKTDSKEKVDIKYYWSMDAEFDQGHDIHLGNDSATLRSNRLNEEKMTLRKSELNEKMVEGLDAAIVAQLGDTAAAKLFDFGYIFATADVRGSSDPVIVSTPNPVNRELFHAEQDQGGWNVIETGGGQDTVIAQTGTKTVITDFDVDEDTLIFDEDAEVHVQVHQSGLVVSAGTADVFLFGLDRDDVGDINLGASDYSAGLEYLMNAEAKNYQFESYEEVAGFISLKYPEIVALDKVDIEKIFVGAHETLTMDDFLGA